MILDRKQARRAAQPELRRRVVSVPEFGPDLELLLSEMDGLRWERYAEGLYEEVTDAEGVTTRRVKVGETYARMVIACAIDAEGEPLYSEEDVPMIAGWPSSLLKRLNDVATALNEPEKKLSAPSDASPSGSA